MLRVFANYSSTRRYNIELPLAKVGRREIILISFDTKYEQIVNFIFTIYMDN